MSELNLFKGLGHVVIEVSFALVPLLLFFSCFFRSSISNYPERKSPIFSRA